MVRSAWIKWARAVEHQKVLARALREFASVESYEYVRTDNAQDGDDPVLSVHWRAVVRVPYPERWSVLLGDVFTNLRAVLDHAFWAAVHDHSGPPARPQRIEFPICPSEAKSNDKAKELAALVAPDVWRVVDAVQPFRERSSAHLNPLEMLRWLSNVDKHRAVHVVERIAVDLGPIVLQSPTPLEVIEEWHVSGPADDGAVVARLKVKRPTASGPIELKPVFAHAPSIQVSDDPVEYIDLASAMDVMTNAVLEVLTMITSVVGGPLPDPESIETGDENDSYAPDAGVVVFRQNGRPVLLPDHAGTNEARLSS